MSVAYGFAGLAFTIFTLWRLIKGAPKRYVFPFFTLSEMNEFCGVHNFDLQGIKKGTKSAIVINDNTAIVDNAIFFRGVGGTARNQSIFSKLNSHISNSSENFLVFYRTQKNCYHLVGNAARVGNYWAEIIDDKIVYVFPMIFLEGHLGRKMYQCKMT
jgi:hypothetical protein